MEKRIYFCGVKKLAGILLIFFYSVSVSGLSIQFHHCCGKFKKVTITTTPEKKCCNHKGQKCCCDQQVAASDLQKYIAIPALKYVAAPFNFVESGTNNSVLRLPPLFLPSASPPILSDHLYLLFCVLRI